jgi:hypothetical protein
MGLFSYWVWQISVKILTGPARLFFLACFFVLSPTLHADEPSTPAPKPVPGCYCNCRQTHTRTGCIKMCELPKYASRWRAVTCRPPKFRGHTPDRGAKPSLPHPARAEHAQLHSDKNGHAR